MKSSPTGKRGGSAAATTTQRGGAAIATPTRPGLPLVSILVAALPIVLLAVQAIRRRWVCDDACIDFRVVSNLLAGHGPVFNIGERVEAYSNPAWVGVLAVFGALGAPLEPAAVWLGVVFAVTALGIATIAAWRLAERCDPTATRPLWLPFGTWMVAALAPVWDFATSGLETGLGFAWLAGAFWVLVQAGMPAAAAGSSIGRARRQRLFWIAGAVWIGAGPLVRPDFIVYTAIFGIALLVLGRSVRPAAGWLVVAALLLPVGYEIFRMGYFAAIVSNSTLAKDPGLARWSHGWLYARDLLRPYVLLLPLLAATCIWISRLRRAARHPDRRARVLVATPIVAAAVHALLVIRAGGDFMHARLLLPSLWCAVTAVGVVGVPWPVRGIGPRVSGLALIVVFGWAVVCSGWLRTGLETGRGATDIVDERAYYVHESRRQNPVRVGDFAVMHFARNGQALRSLADSIATRPAAARERCLLFPRRADPSAPGWLPLADRVPASILVVAANRNIGITGFLAGPAVHVVDVHGLADPFAARLPSSGTGRVGHDKMLAPSWITARFAAAGSVVDPQDAAARAALEQPPLADLHAAVTEPLGPGRFFSNIRLAPRLHRLRIAADPTLFRP